MKRSRKPRPPRPYVNALLKRIGELERRVKELEARPTAVNHYHTHFAPQSQPLPQFVPAPGYPSIVCNGLGDSH